MQFYDKQYFFIELEREVLIFSEAFYSGIYTSDAGLEFTDTITLIRGYDDSVTFDLEGGEFCIRIPRYY